MDRDVHEIRLNQWEKLIQDASTCGKSKKQWCADNGISKDMFYYWQRKVRRRAIEKSRLEPEGNLPVFATLAPPSDGASYIKSEDAAAPDSMDANISPAVILCSGEYRLLVGNCVSEQALTTVLRAIKNA